MIPINIPLRQFEALRDEITQAVSSVMDSGRWVKGEKTLGFQEAFADYCGLPYCLGVANGTDALELALRAAKSAGREVITTANAGGYATSACRVVGALPVYVDVSHDTLLMDPARVMDAVTPATQAIVATHLYGRMVNVVDLRQCLKNLGREDILIIEDCAQAHGAKLQGKRAGAHGEIATFSFYPTKNLGALGDAGAIVCKDKALFSEIEALHQYGWHERNQSSIPFGRNSRMDEIQAAVLLVKLPQLDAWNIRRRSIIQTYGKAAGSGISVLPAEKEDCVAHLAVIRHPERTRLRENLEKAGIGTDIHYPVLDCEQKSQSELPKRCMPLPESRSAVQEILTIPCFPEMTDSEVEQVAEALASFS